jgi:hypothetical protein
MIIDRFNGEVFLDFLKRMIKYIVEELMIVTGNITLAIAGLTCIYSLLFAIGL